MHRASFLSMLEAYRLRYPGEAGHAGLFLDFVKTHPDCFERSLSTGHITGSCWLLNRAGSHVLLTHHRKLNRWIQLGGHVDGCPDVLASALREAREESGIEKIVPLAREIFDLDRHLVPAFRAEQAHYHYDVRFLLQAVASDDYTVSDESHDLAWVPLDGLETYSSEPGMLRMRQKTWSGAWQNR